MAHFQTELMQLRKIVEEKGVQVNRETQGFPVKGVNMVFPFITISLCLRGSGRARYDMEEMTQHKNDLGIIMPGHLMHPIDCTDDYSYIAMNISEELFNDLEACIFSHDYEKFNTSPLCHLTDEQAQRIQSLMLVLEDISSHRFEDLTHRRQMLVYQLAIMYEFVNHYRKEQDRLLKASRHKTQYTQFCELVLAHYREEKELLFYAKEMGVSLKQLNKIVHEVTHDMTPREWIEHYVVTQAKRMIEAKPEASLKQTAYALGFSEPSSFYRYFKRATGMTAKAYRDEKK